MNPNEDQTAPPAVDRFAEAFGLESCCAAEEARVETCADRLSRLEQSWGNCTLGIPEIVDITQTLGARIEQLEGNISSIVGQIVAAINTQADRLGRLEAASQSCTLDRGLVQELIARSLTQQQPAQEEAGE
jgi:hypothetical protein